MVVKTFRQVTQALRAVLNYIRDIVALVRMFWIPLCISGISSFVLIFPDQILEYYRVLLENSQFAKAEFRDEVAGGVVALIVMASCIAFTARVLEVVHRDDISERLRTWRRALRWGPMVLGSAPIFALSYGLWSSADVGHNVKCDDLVAEIRAFGERDFADTLTELCGWIANYTPYLRYACAVVFVGAIAFFLVCSLTYHTNSGAWFYSYSKRPISVLVSATMIGVVVGLFYQYPVVLPQAFGTIGILSLFAGFLAINLCQLHIWSRVSDVPFIAILICCAIAFSALDLNDNHELRRIGPDDARREAADADRKPPQVEENFLAWYRNRPDREDPAYLKGKYPVYIVAAQGGGIYAAAEALLFLVKMQAVCERFSQHLFAISAVSGGAVGAALYSALSEAFPTDRVDCVPLELHTRQPSQLMRAAYLAADNLLWRDYLSPLVARALFPDFVQRFLPITLSEWSRARALEKALEHSWEQALRATSGGTAWQGKALEAGVLASWTAKGSRPALLLNTTEAGSGRRRLIAPFSFGEAKGYDIRFLPMSKEYDVPLSAAAIASARFPWLTPAAWFWGQERATKRTKFRLVDGGFFENSGVATAMDLIAELERIAQRHELHVEFHLIVMTSGGFSTQTFFGFGEFFAPIQSLLNTRHARTYATIDLADRQLGSVSAPEKDGATMPLPIRRLQRVELNDLLTPLPLGWRLSRASVFQIDRQTGLLGHCDPDEKFQQKPRIRAFTSADCVKELIYHQLRGDDIRKSLQAAQRK